ncbi:hypothetical protein [Streptomyces anulatus]|uniref:hypothetical protein n=1 Tax=Streptomyces anulatus TaxID=1892 RepID=UPI001C278D12|nr:hypothetical protein [Streptomyces anulatus]
MALEPVEATLIAASVTSVVSTAAVLLTHLLTRGRERRHKVWDRRMDTYAEVVRMRQQVGRFRQQVLENEVPPDGPIDPDYESRTFSVTEAHLAMFGTRVVTGLDLMCTTAFNNWMEAMLEWQVLRARASTDPEAEQKAAAKWLDVQRWGQTSATMDIQLLGAILKEAEFKEVTRWSRLRPKRLYQRAKVGLERARPKPQQAQELS